MRVYNISKINEWEQCQLKYYGHYINSEEWQNQFSVNLNNVFGKLLHEFFEKFYQPLDNSIKFKKNIITLDNWKEDFKNSWYKVLTENEELNTNNSEVFLEKGFIALENFYNREKERDFKIPLFLEQHFRIPIGQEFIINGKIDRIDEELDGSLTIIDYKITNYTKTVNQAKEDFQLLTYALACEFDILERFPNKVGWYYPLQGLDVFSKPSNETQAELLSQIMSIDSLINIRGDNKSLYPCSSRTGFCDNCGYKHKCPEYAHEYNDFKEKLEQADIIKMIERAYELDKQIKELESELEPLKKEIKDFMVENEMKTLDKAKCMIQNRGSYDPKKIWDILKKYDNATDYISIKANLKNDLSSFSLAEQRIIGDSYIPKLSYALSFIKLKEENL